MLDLCYKVDPMSRPILTFLKRHFNEIFPARHGNSQLFGAIELMG